MADEELTHFVTQAISTSPMQSERERSAVSRLERSLSLRCARLPTNAEYLRMSVNILISARLTAHRFFSFSFVPPLFIYETPPEQVQTHRCTCSALPRGRGLGLFLSSTLTGLLPVLVWFRVETCQNVAGSGCGCGARVPASSDPSL